MLFKKDKWIGFEGQAPDPKLEIFTEGNPDSPDITYCSDPMAGPWAKLLNYTFSESVDSMEGSFSFAVEDSCTKEEEEILDGKSPIELIPVRSIVKIYEGDLKKPAFVGIIRRCHFGTTMTGQGAKRSITFTGKSIISCIAEYTISLDARIQGVADAFSKQQDLTVKLADLTDKAQKAGKAGLTIKDFMKETWKHFKEVSEYFGISTTGIADAIRKFIGDGPDAFVKVTGKEQILRYDVACVFYNAANNVIADVWRNILPLPVYEIFSRCENGDPRVIARQVPYDPDDWVDIDIYEISPVSLISYELDRSDEEVYTAFVSYIIGSAMDREFYMAVNQTGNDDIVVHDREKQKIYGFKPLEINFNGYDREGNTENQEKSSLRAALQSLNKKAAYWYSRLDDMYSGTITICTDFNSPETNPRAGCRAKFMGGEFYINKADHSWTYGGTPTIKLTVSRGMVYRGIDGEMLPGKEGMLYNVGLSFRELRENPPSVPAILGFKPASEL